jgi:hypothetical protein
MPLPAPLLQTLALLQGTVAGVRLTEQNCCTILKGQMMKKSILLAEESGPKTLRRADRLPTEGFVTVVDGHFKSEFDTLDAAEVAGRKLKSAYPMLQVEIYDAANNVRSLLSGEPDDRTVEHAA